MRALFRWTGCQSRAIFLTTKKLDFRPPSCGQVPNKQLPRPFCEATRPKRIAAAFAWSHPPINPSSQGAFFNSCAWSGTPLWVLYILLFLAPFCRLYCRRQPVLWQRDKSLLSWSFEDARLKARKREANLRDLDTHCQHHCNVHRLPKTLQTNSEKNAINDQQMIWPNALSLCVVNC